MTYRPRKDPYTVIPNASATPPNTGSMASSITSVPTIVQGLSMMSYEVDWSGTSPVGTISVQVSNTYSLNPDGTVKNAGTWTTMSFLYNGSVVTSVPVSGNTGSGFLDIDATGAYAMQLVYTAASGTGTMLATFNAKVA